MKYFNDVTKEIYESAYIHKQSQFLAYLNGQRHFRWGTKTRIEKLKHVISSYEAGVLPKVNISVGRYKTMPDNPSVRDLSFANRADNHVKATKNDAERLLEQSQNRKVELFDSHMELKKWAENENKVVSQFIEEVSQLKSQVTTIGDDVANTAQQLNKRFSGTDLSSFESKRKKRRVKEQKSRNKKKLKVMTVRKARTLLQKSGFPDDVIDNICPTQYGELARKVISLGELVNPDKKCIL